MFGGSSTEYDEIVAKTTDENLTSENWEMILNLCDKVADEGQAGAHAVIVAILRRLAHRNPNVQLYALSLSESLDKNLGIDIHREIASRAFTQGLEKLITDRNTHEKVRKRALGLIAEWAAEFENDESLGIMEDCYNNLKAKNYKFEQPHESPPPPVDDEIRRKEEEELQRVLEMSRQDLGGRARWGEYTLASSSAGPSGPSGSVGRSSSATPSSPGAPPSSPPTGYNAPKYQGGYAPARTPSPDRVAAEQRQQQLEYQKQLQAQQLRQAKEHQAKEQEAKEQEAKEKEAKEKETREREAREREAREQQAREQQAREQAAAAASASPSIPIISTPTAISVTTSTPPTPNVNIVTRVRALYTFEPTEPGELAFDKGDIIKVVDRGYKDWWRGQLKGRTGIFPVNYVEPMPEPTAAELAKETEQEAAVFAQAVNVEKLLNMLRAFDPNKDNLADDEEIQELYRSSMALRPKIVKLIDKYSQKRADLVSMNETFLRARTIFDTMMEESLARHTGIYDQPSFRPSSQYGPRLQGRPGSSAMGGPQPFGWGPSYDQQQIPSQPTPQPRYGGYPGPGGPAPLFPVGPQSQPLSNTTPAPGQLSMGTGYVPNQGTAPQQGPSSQQGPVPTSQPQPQGMSAAPAGYAVGGYVGHQISQPYSQQGPTPYPAQPQQQQQQQPQQQPQQLYQPQSQSAQSYQPPTQTEYQHQVQQLYQQTGQQPVQQAQPQPSHIDPVVSYQPQTQPQPVGSPHTQTEYQQVPQLYQQPNQQPVQQAQPQPLYADPVVSYQPQTQPHGSPHTQPEPQPQVQPQPIPQQQVGVQPQPLPQQVEAQPQLIPQQVEVQPPPIPQQQVEVQPQSIPQQLVEGQPQTPQQQVEVQPQPIPQQQLEVQPQPIPQQQSQPQPKPAQPISGPYPYPYDPSYTYTDQNAQAWARYYAQGGLDLTGSVYFISIPGVKEASPSFVQQPQQLQTGYDLAQKRPGEEQTLAQSVSYQAHPQTQPFISHEQSYQTRLGVGNAAYDPIGVMGGTPAASVPTAMPNMPRYQLSDNPVPQAAMSQSQPQGNSDGHSSGPSQVDSGDSGPVPQPSSPAKSFFSTAPLNIKRAQSPPQANTTPSWVLPKKANTPGFSPVQTNGGSPTAGGIL